MKKPKEECIAMILAGGEGKRLEGLTKQTAKPAVHFGGKYRIIDFPLSNCVNSGMYTVGVITQYQPLELNSYIGMGSAWDLDRRHSGVTILPPYAKKEGGRWYQGTADAIYQNIQFIEQYDPTYVILLSGDHIYKMDYSQMLSFHKEKGADTTIAVIDVPWSETNRFGILKTTEDQWIKEFVEKPIKVTSNLASMGIYIFNWRTLHQLLHEDARNQNSEHDFGKNVIPTMLDNGLLLAAYVFRGYWRDIGTISSLWRANMDLLSDHPEFDLFEEDWKIYSVDLNQPPHYCSPQAKIYDSFINEGSHIEGEVNHSIISSGVSIGQYSVIRDSVIMPNVKIGSHVTIERAIVNTGMMIEKGNYLKTKKSSRITLIGD